MKRILVAITVLCVVISTVSAGLLSFGFGVHALNSQPVGIEIETGTISDYQFGAEARLGLLFAEASVSGIYETSQELIRGIATIGTSMSLFDLLHVGIGIGPYFAVSLADGTWLALSDETLYPVGDLEELFEKTIFYYRAHGDIKLGRLSLGVTYEVPTKGYRYGDSVFDLLPDKDKAKIGTSILFWLF